MVFIERWFHVSPDYGSGSTELIYVVAIAVLLIAAICWRQLTSFGQLLGTPPSEEKVTPQSAS